MFVECLERFRELKPILFDEFAQATDRDANPTDGPGVKSHDSEIGDTFQFGLDEFLVFFKSVRLYSRDAERWNEFLGFGRPQDASRLINYVCPMKFPYFAWRQFCYSARCFLEIYDGIARRFVIAIRLVDSRGNLEDRDRLSAYLKEPDCRRRHYWMYAILNPLAEVFKARMGGES